VARFTVLGPTHPIKGGISHYTTILVRELRKKHDVRFISYRFQYPRFLYPGTSQTDEKSEGIKVENEPIFHSLNPFSLSRIVHLIRKDDPDIFLLNWVTFFFAPHIHYILKCVKPMRTRALMICHNVKQHEDRPMEAYFTRLAFKHCDNFIVHSEEDRINLLKYRPDANVRKNFHPIYDIFANQFPWERSEARRQLNIGGDVLLFFGVVRPYKGLIHLVNAMPEILSRRNVTLLVVGDFWKGDAEYRAKIEELGITEHVRLYNQYTPNEEVGKYFMAADLAVLPYESATQSGITQIAYGFELPCVVTNVGGLPEVVDDGRTGYIVPPKDPSAITDAVIGFFNERDKVDWKGNIREFRKRFSWDHMITTIESFLDG
jgi:glycosyltransferase involved in cell wall biosynthesis